MLAKSDARSSLFKFQTEGLVHPDAHQIAKIKEKISDPDIIEIDLANLNLEIHDDVFFIDLLELILKKNELKKLIFPKFVCDMNASSSKIVSLINQIMLMPKFELDKLNFKSLSLSDNHFVQLLKGIEETRVSSLALPTKDPVTNSLCDPIRKVLGSPHLRKVNLSGLTVYDNNAGFLEVLKTNTNLQKFSLPALIPTRNKAFLSSLPQATYIDFSTIPLDCPVNPSKAKLFLDWISEQSRLEAVKISNIKYSPDWADYTDMSVLGNFLAKSNANSKSRLKRVYLSDYFEIFSSREKAADFYEKYIRPSHLTVFVQDNENSPYRMLSSSSVYAEGTAQFFASRPRPNPPETFLDVLPPELLRELPKYDRLGEPSAIINHEFEKYAIITSFIKEVKQDLLQPWRDFGGFFGGNYLLLNKSKNVSIVPDDLKNRLLLTPVCEALNLINNTKNYVDVNKFLWNLEKIFDDAVHNPDWIHWLKRNLLQGRDTINKFETMLTKIKDFRVEQSSSPILKRA